PNRIVAVIVPELAETRWYEYLLHNQRAALLKVLLFLQGQQRVVVINVPWYLQPKAVSGTAASPEGMKPGTGHTRQGE
ncbi:MAG TPA: hypothetical protein VKT32_13160, partial [Chthonomonadaceae bacterium]|nr:hypothetical protein [Chthonomonadaceae bacterium]